MSTQPYVIDDLLGRLRDAWARLDVSAEDFAVELRKNQRKPIHPNTLRKLAGDRWSPSVAIIRDLEDVLLRNPLSTEHMRPRLTRRPRSHREPAAADESTSHPAAAA